MIDSDFLIFTEVFRMGLSIAEIALIVVVALLVIGPKKLPDVAKSLGKGYGEFRKQFDDLKKSVDVSSTFDDAPATPAPSNNESSFKSKWEEQEASFPQEEDTAGRAKRSDLIKEDNKDG